MTFFYDNVKKKIYIIQLIDFKRDDKNKIYKLKKIFYKLKQFLKI